MQSRHVTGGAQGHRDVRIAQPPGDAGQRSHRDVPGVRRQEQERDEVHGTPINGLEVEGIAQAGQEPEGSVQAVEARRPGSTSSQANAGLVLAGSLM